MTYRQVHMQCPRCRIELTRKVRNDGWRCTKCRGVVIETPSLVRKLYLIDPSLAPKGGADGIVTSVRRSKEAVLPCAACNSAMKPVWLHGVEVDRCYEDEMIWFDATELDRVLTSVIEQHDARKSWLQRLLDHLYAN